MPEAISHVRSPNGVAVHVALASHHCSISLLLVLITSYTLGTFALKVQLLRSSQMRHRIIASIVFVPFRVQRAALLIIVSTISVVVFPCNKTSGSRAAHPFHFPTLVQVALENGHSQNRCTEDSRFLFHREQKYLFSHPLRWRRSLHHNLTCCSSQQNVFTWPGAHTFQINDLNFVGGRSENCMLYAELTEYSAAPPAVQAISSSMPSISVTPVPDGPEQGDELQHDVIDIAMP